MYLLWKLLDTTLVIYLWIILIHVAVSWLIILDVINIKSPQAKNLVDLLNKATEPVYKPLRKYIPPIGGIDITPMVVIFGIYILREVLARILL